MASANIARLGVLLGLDMAQFTADMDKAVFQTKRLEREAQKANERALKDAYAIKTATEDYGKTLTKVQQIERAISEGRYQGASQAALDQIRARAAAYDKEVESVKKLNTERLKMMGGLTPQQQAQIGYQMTDIFTSLVSGQNPVMVLIQQGGQLRDVFGGAGNAIRAIIETIGLGRLAFLGFAGAVGGVAFAAYKGAEEMARLRDDLILTGNIAGKAKDEFIQMGNAISSSVGISIGNARDIMAQLASTGKFTATSIEEVGKAIAKYAQLSGKDGKEAAEQIIPLLDGTARSAKQLNEKYNFLTLAQYKQIEALERQGRTQEAIKLQATLLEQTWSDQKRDLGTLETAWTALANAISKAKDALLNFGRAPGLDRALELEKLINEQAAEIERRQSLKMKTGSQEAALAAFKKELQEIYDRLGKEMDVERKKAEEKEKNKKGISDYEFLGGAQGVAQRASELERARLKAQYATRSEMMDEQQRIDFEFVIRYQELLSEMQLKNQQQRNLLIKENQEVFNNNLLVAQAEHQKKSLDLEIKYATQLNQSKDSFRRMEIQGYEASAQFIVDERIRREQANRANIKEFDQRKADFELQEKMVKFRTANIFATDKEIELKRIQLETEKALNEERKKDIYGGEGGAARLAAAEERIRSMGKMREVMVELEDQQKRVAAMTDAVWGNMSRAIENFVRTGKLSFKDLARSIIQDLLLIQMRTQMTTIFKSFVGNIFGGGFGTGFGYGNQDLGAFLMGNGRASGGPVAGNTPYIVGERGPELFMPSSAGTIVPNHALGMGGVTNVTNNYIQAIDVQSFEQRLLGSSNAIWAANQYAQKSLATGRGRT